MKKNEPDELRAEYDFSRLKGGVRGKYAAAYRGGYDVKAIVAALQREEAESGLQVVSSPPKRLSEKQRARRTG